jgi:hypothetical protein
MLAACKSSKEPVPPTPVDPRVTCTVDAECEVFASCCAHCSPNGTVVSVNRQHRDIGSALTWSPRSPRRAQAISLVGRKTTCEDECPMNESGCVELAPSHDPICKRGTCARRETTYADRERTKVLKTVEVDNAPGLLDRGEDLLLSRARWAAVVSHACTRHDACGTDEPSCSMSGVPVTVDRETAACRKEIDAMTCEQLMGVFLNTPPPACAQLREKARQGTSL